MYRLLYVYGTTETGPLVLACCFNSPAVQTDCIARIHQGDEALLPSTTYTDSFLQLLPTYNVLRGNWSHIRTDLDAAGKLSLHLRDISLCFEPGLKRGGFSAADSQTCTIFTCQAVEVWSE